MKWTAEPARILSCSCKHPVQDKMYGTNMRVFNPCKPGYRCTVCSKVRSS